MEIIVVSMTISYKRTLFDHDTNSVTSGKRYPTQKSSSVLEALFNCATEMLLGVNPHGCRRKMLHLRLRQRIKDPRTISCAYAIFWYREKGQ